MDELAEAVDDVATETAFSGVVRVDCDDDIVLAKAYGFAHRGLGVTNRVDSQLGIASGGKGLTALTVVRLIELGDLGLTTTARSVLGDDLPLIGDRVTVEHLLGHWSGIGDYLDEDAMGDIADYVMAVPVHELADTEQYLQVLDGHPARSAAGERFSYCNGGYVVLALMAERATGTPFHGLVDQHVCRPAGMADTAFLRSDELPGRASTGYLAAEGLRTNVLHLPVRGSGDGGVYSTVADIHALWSAFFAGRIVSRESVVLMVRRRAERYGLGFWLHESTDVVILEGHDAGASFHTVHDPVGRITHTVISNTSEGAWPIARRLNELLGT